MIFLAPLLPYIASIGIGVTTGYISSLITPPKEPTLVQNFFNYPQPSITYTNTKDDAFCYLNFGSNSTGSIFFTPSEDLASNRKIIVNGVSVPYNIHTWWASYLQNNPNGTYSRMTGVYQYDSLSQFTCLIKRTRDDELSKPLVPNGSVASVPVSNTLPSNTYGSMVQNMTPEIWKQVGSNAQVYGNGARLTQSVNNNFVDNSGQTYIDIGGTSPYSCYQIMTATNYTSHYEKNTMKCLIREPFSIDDNRTILAKDGTSPNLPIMTNPSPTAEQFYNIHPYGTVMPIADQIQSAIEQQSWLDGNNGGIGDNTTDDNTTQKQIDYRSRLDNIIKNTADSEDWLEKIKKMVYGEVEHSDEVKSKEDDLKEFEDDFAQNYNTYNINKNVYLDGVFNSFAVPIVGGSNNCDVHLQFSVMDREINEDLCPWLIKLRVPLEIIFSLFLMYWSYRVFFFFYFKITDLVSKG